MATLDADFEAQAKAAVLDSAEAHARADLAPALETAARERWIAYAREHDYDIEHIWQDASHTVTREGDAIHIRIEWPDLSALFEFGVSPHTIEGDPLLHFYYERIDQWITTESVEWGSETGGIPESRAIRDTLNDLRRQL